ncbi:DUF2624 domain-containing protein [Peribacillus cavernae]|uniref:DUF2624 domain-containing protein n=1 Tax=Peribacillus cavernae TaxID=1674310 RepID=A0A433HJN1_9BACI|nr:DUF2624 family protein [Peribacillus cavernae]MDQ0218287.1 hypothetical protein [Peribacillus cavernae]RUQ28429.1 DUF2624 domain-containing protein [Peribacillus cavernae]
MKLFEMMINHKVNTITPNELLKLARQYDVDLKPDQARIVSKIVAGKNINVFNKTERLKALELVSAQTGLATSKELETIFNQLTANL